jgi:hypothetical protein
VHLAQSPGKGKKRCPPVPIELSPRKAESRGRALVWGTLHVALQKDRVEARAPFARSIRARTRIEPFERAQDVSA